MPVTAARGLVPVGLPGPLEPRTVLVADQLLRGGGLADAATAGATAPDAAAEGRASIACPAAALVVGELRRHGIRTVRGALHLDPDPEPSGASALAVVLDDASGLGVAWDDCDRPGRLAAQLAMAAWLAVATPRTVQLAAPRSFCAGVERAVEVVERVLAHRGAPVYVRRQIVHNAHVVADLQARGAVFVDELDAVPEGATVVFSAHGVSPSVHAEAAHRGLDVIDATCPLVTKVHLEARRFAARGDTVLLIGHANHDEVEGTMGEAPGRMVLVQSVTDVADIHVDDPTRVSYLTQTTLAADETNAVIDALRTRFPALRGPHSDDICYATTNRQNALSAIAGDADLVLVVGSANSSNSRRLVELASRHGTPAHLIDDAGDIRPEWLAGIRVVGLTAGASAPPALVHDVVTALSGLGPVTVEEHETTRETVQFTLPSAPRPS